MLRQADVFHSLIVLINIDSISFFDSNQQIYSTLDSCKLFSAVLCYWRYVYIGVCRLAVFLKGEIVIHPENLFYFQTHGKFPHGKCDRN